MLGQSGDDHIRGDLGDDMLAGGGGRDTLNGGLGNDTLKGDEGFDTYIFSSQELNATDTIIDSDGQGQVIVDDINWSNKNWTETNPGSNNWTDNEGNQLTLTNRQLTLTLAGGQSIATINDFTAGDLASVGCVSDSVTHRLE